MTTLLAKAIDFAQQKHANQKRKATRLPYITHLSGVATLVKVFKKSKNIEELVCAGYLHDILEDTDTTEDELLALFGPLVTSLVVEVTNDKEEIKRLGKSKYLQDKMLNMSSYALTLKLCDRLHNVSDSPSKKTLEETRGIIDYLICLRPLNKTQSDLVNRIMVILDNAKIL